MNRKIQVIYYPYCREWPLESIKRVRDNKFIGNLSIFNEIT